MNSILENVGCYVKPKTVKHDAMNTVQGSNLYYSTLYYSSLYYTSLYYYY
jgi:hypothetical protein